MKKYIVCVNNLSDNDMKMVRVEAENEKDAIVLAVDDNLDVFENYNTLSLEDLQGYYFDGDTLVSDPVEVIDWI